MNRHERYWQPGPDRLTIGDGTLDLWRFPLCFENDAVDFHRSLLTPQENARADKLLIPVKKYQFVLCRAMTRRILSRYLGTEPQQLVVTTSEDGKPLLNVSVHERSLAFNLSHSGAWGMLAITSGAAVGVDVEQIDAHLDFNGIATRFLTSAEQNQLRFFSAVRQRRAFYRLWTRKEAVLKMIGCGFSGLAQGSLAQAEYLSHVVVSRTYVATVAVAAAISIRRCYQITSLAD